MGMTLPLLCESLLLWNVKPHIPNLSREKNEFLVFCGLLRLILGLEDQLMAASEEEVVSITDLVRLTATICLYCLTYFIDSER